MVFTMRRKDMGTPARAYKHIVAGFAVTVYLARLGLVARCLGCGPAGIRMPALAMCCFPDHASPVFLVHTANTYL